MKACCVCDSFAVKQNFPNSCAKASVCPSFSVQKFAVCKGFLCEIFSVKSVGVACFGVEIRFLEQVLGEKKGEIVCECAEKS